ncbi:Hypothetical predicted protein, partial [Mytilus galloprovincialis]
TVETRTEHVVTGPVLANAIITLVICVSAVVKVVIVVLTRTRVVVLGLWMDNAIRTAITCSQNVVKVAL